MSTDDKDEIVKLNRLVYPLRASEPRVINGVSIKHGVVLRLRKSEYFYDDDWLNPDDDQELELVIFYVGEEVRRPGPDDSFDDDWVILGGHQYPNSFVRYTHVKAVRVNALPRAITAIEGRELPVTTVTRWSPFRSLQ